MSGNKIKVSQSKLKQWRKCKAAYAYKYREKLRRKKKSRPLMFGSLIHEMIDVQINGGDWEAWLDKFEEENRSSLMLHIDEYGDIIDDAHLIMAEYVDYWPKSSLRYQAVNNKKAEHEFEVEVEDGIIITGKIDGIAKTPNKLRWMVEHKTFSKKPNEDERWRNLQSVVYIHIMEILGWPLVDGTCWDYVKSKPPAVPQILKSGLPSTRNCDTLPTKLLEWARENDIDRKDIGDLLDAAKANRDTYFERIFTPVKQSVIDLVWHDFIQTAREMRDQHDTFEPSRTIERHCSWCDYEPICRSEMLGNDSDFIKETEYYTYGEETTAKKKQRAARTKTKRDAA